MVLEPGIGYLHVQLQVQHTNMYANFLHGYHVIHRGYHFLAGFSIDVAIEQISVKSVRHGKGIALEQHSVTDWLLLGKMHW